MEWLLLGGIGGCLVALVWKRMELGVNTKHRKPPQEAWAISQTTGNKEVQSDCVLVFENRAGIMAVLADGIGKANTGKIAAQVAADTVLDAFEPYHVLHKPEYLCRTAFLEAHSRVQRTIGERRGGASMGAVFTDRSFVYYALAGNIRIALLRNGELIPLSKGQTLDVLAKEAYYDGILSKHETIWSLEEKQTWNYLGKDGFQEIEICKVPVSLKAGDMILMMSQGISEELSWMEIEDILLTDNTLKEKADQLVRETEAKETKEKENGSVLLLVAEVCNEKSQF